MAKSSKKAAKDKSIHDPIHGLVTVTPLMVSIMDTPEFQRLRDLKQLGAAHFVYPSATHTRLEHSLGVGHLAKIMMKSLQRNQPILGITERDVEITQVAALVHDIGHGPYSHLYDGYVIRKGEDEHEVRGCKIFRRMASSYHLSLTTEEVDRIVNMIDPPERLKNDWKYQVVANKVSQVDVDKLDYIQRDSHRLGLKFGGEYSRLLSEARVCAVARPNQPTGTYQLGWPEKMQFELFSLFCTRYRLHKQVYNHHAVRAHEFHIANILRGLQEQGVPFQQLTDSVITCQLHPGPDALRERLLIAHRKIPKLVGELTTSATSSSAVEPNPRVIIDLILDKVKIGFSSGEKNNPLHGIYYFDRDAPSCDAGNGSFPVGYGLDPAETSFCVPRTHQETIVRLYTMNTSARGVKEARSWWAEYKGEQLKRMSRLSSGSSAREN